MWRRGIWDFIKWEFDKTAIKKLKKIVKNLFVRFMTKTHILIQTWQIYVYSILKLFFNSVPKINNFFFISSLIKCKKGIILKSPNRYWTNAYWSLDRDFFDKLFTQKINFNYVKKKIGPIGFSYFCLLFLLRSETLLTEI